METKVKSYRLSDEMMLAISNYAESEGISMTNAVKRLISAGLEVLTL